MSFSKKLARFALSGALAVFDGLIAVPDEAVTR